MKFCDFLLQLQYLQNLSNMQTNRKTDIGSRIVNIVIKDIPKRVIIHQKPKVKSFHHCSTFFLINIEASNNGNLLMSDTYLQNLHMCE